MSHYVRFMLLCLLMIIAFIGCAKTTPQNSQLSSSQLGEVSQLSNEVVETTSVKIEKPGFFYQKSADKKSEIVEGYIRNTVNNKFEQPLYYYNYSDLNNDLKHEILVLIQQKDQQNTIQEVLIFNEDGKSIGRIENWSGPLVVSSGKENGYNILYKPMGRGQYACYSFKENQFVLKPSQIVEFDALDGIGFFSDVGEKRGFQLK